MTEDTHLRSYLRDKLMGMKYGHSHVINRDLIMEAWPPIVFRASLDEMTALVESLLRLNSEAPDIPEYKTTDERIKDDLDDSFTWHSRMEDGDYVFHRKESACPKCKGRKYMRKGSINIATDLKAIDVPISSDNTFDVSYEQCDCEPLRGGVNDQ